VGPGKRTRIITAAKISLGGFWKPGGVSSATVASEFPPAPQKQPKKGAPVQRGIGNAKRRAAGRLENHQNKDHHSVLAQRNHAAEIRRTHHGQEETVRCSRHDLASRWSNGR
jgi:hypothetical protein